MLEYLPLLKATWETIYMVFIASFLGIFFGLIVGLLLYLTNKKQVLANASLHRTLGLVVNTTRSIPFVILMIAVIPLTRFLVGTTIGTNAAIIPLTIAAIPFFARICENAFAEVPYGLIEAAHAMGASTTQMITKILLPESLVSLIRGSTLTIIGLIGYSAMAGVVGGGGLGELAINYGYQRFDIKVMLETVLILILMVQLIQMLGDKLAARRQHRSIVYAVIVLLITCLFYQVWSNSFPQENALRIGIMAGEAEKILQVAQQVAKKEYGLNLKIILFSDYVQPNTALNNHDLDANIFQHAPYLKEQIKARHYKLAILAKTFVYPMGFYSKKITHINQLKNGAVVAIPNDPSNTSRSLLLLQKYNLIQLRKSSTLMSVRDIVENNRRLKFKSLDAAQLPRVLQDADLVAITNDFIGPTGLTIKQAVLKEGGDSPYANLIVVHQQDQSKPLLHQLIAIMHSKPVQDETQKIYPNGAALPAW